MSLRYIGTFQYRVEFRTYPAHWKTSSSACRPPRNEDHEFSGIITFRMERKSGTRSLRRYNRIRPRAIRLSLTMTEMTRSAINVGRMRWRSISLAINPGMMNPRMSDSSVKAPL